MNEIEVVASPLIELETTTPAVDPGDTFDALASRGMPAGECYLYVESIDGVPMLPLQIDAGYFDAAGAFASHLLVPPEAAGLTFTLVALGLDRYGKGCASNRVDVVVN
jgi:hypothetical protein